MRYRLSGSWVSLLLTFWLVLGTAGPGLANQVPEECTRPQQVIQSDPDLHALCLSTVEGRIPAAGTSPIAGSTSEWMVVVLVGGALVLAAASGVLLRSRASRAK